MTIEGFHIVAIDLRHSQKFRLGQIVITHNALEAIPPGEVRVVLARHAGGDWGELCEEDRRENARSLTDGGRLMSAHRAVEGTKFWIITEADRSVTTVLLPEDY